MRNILPLVLLLAFWTLTSQKKLDPTADHIATAKLLGNTYPDDDVVILSSVENISFGVNSNKELVTVNRSLDRELMNISSRADIIQYEYYDDYSDIDEFEVRYRNKKLAYIDVKDEYYEDDDIFYHDARLKYTQLDFPVQGYKYHFHSKKSYKDIKYFTRIDFAAPYPILEKQVKVQVPKWLDLEFKEFNLEGYEVSVDSYSGDNEEMVEHRFTVKNVNAYPKEENSPGQSHIMPHLLVLAKSAKIKGDEKTLFKSVDDLYEWYSSLSQSVDDEPEKFRHIVDKITRNAPTDLERAKGIYYWVQDNIRYIAFEDGIAGFKPEASQSVFSNRYGDCKGMANLTKQMLQLAGLDARLCWIGTKRIAYDYSLPSVAVDNHMICALLHDGKKYYLDSTEKLNAFGEYAERIQGRPVMIEDGDNYILDNIPISKSSDNKESINIEFSIAGEDLEGQVEKKYLGEKRSNFLYGIQSVQKNRTDDVLVYYLSDGRNDMEITNIDVSNFTDREANIEFSYDLNVQGAVSFFDNEVYVDVEQGDHFQDLDLSDRLTDYEFSHKRHLEVITKLNIPEGYQLKYHPDNYEIENDEFLVKFNYQTYQNQLVYTKTLVFKKAKISKHNFSNWQKALENIKSQYQEQIILTK